MRTLTAPARLGLLLPLLDPERDQATVRGAVAAFLRSFDGSADAGHVEFVPDANDGRPEFLRTAKRQPTDDELAGLAALLRLLLEQGFGDATLAGGSFPTPSLRLSVRGASRQKPGWRIAVSGNPVLAGGAKALRAYRAAGAYVLMVEGATVDVVPFLVAHLLTQPNMVAVRRCPVPGCNRFIIAATAARGRPRTFCSDTCRLQNAVAQAQRKEQAQRKRRKR